jgi:DNA-binding NarL/FixJ family response regulator
MHAFRILVADDHPVFRFGVSALLSAHEGWQICGEAADGREAVEKCRQLKPDLLILDICMPRLNGMDAARQILKEDATQRILVVTDVNSEQIIRDCLVAGVLGWIFKSDAGADLINAVAALERHTPSFSRRVSDLVMDGFLRRHRVGAAPDILPRLSPREREVVQLLGEGNSTKDVARTLNMAVKTAETHRSNIMLKLKLHSIAELVLYAVRNEIVHVASPATVLHFPKPAIVERTLPRQGIN